MCPNKTGSNEQREREINMVLSRLQYNTFTFVGLFFNPPKPTVITVGSGDNRTLFHLRSAGGADLKLMRDRDSGLLPRVLTKRRGP